MRWTLLLCAMLGLSACAATEQPTSGGTGDTVTTSPTEATMTDPPDGELPEPITEAADGSRIELAVGTEIPWRLSSDWDWAEPVADSGSVQFTPVDYLVDPGYREWLLMGTAAGTTEVSVDGTSACGDDEACPDRTVTLTVDVTG